MFMVKWCDIMSRAFRVSNGVRQGGILSPHLFCLYIDDLIQRLNRSNTGCNLNGQMINNLGYADDMTLLSPSPKGLQALVNICEDYSI